MTQIAFIGLGHMGLPMARNLLKAGYPLKVFDLQRSAVDTLAGEGAVAADSATDAIDQAKVVTEFPEGVRARLIDKDQTPKWHWPDVAAIPAAVVEAHFASVWEGEHPLADL